MQSTSHEPDFILSCRPRLLGRVGPGWWVLAAAWLWWFASPVLAVVLIGWVEFGSVYVTAGVIAVLLLALGLAGVLFFLQDKVHLIGTRMFGLSFEFYEDRLVIRREGTMTVRWNNIER